MECMEPKDLKCLLEESKIEIVTYIPCYMCGNKSHLKLLKTLSINTQIEIQTCLDCVAQLPYGQQIVETIIPHDAPTGIIELQKIKNKKTDE